MLHCLAAPDLSQGKSDDLVQGHGAYTLQKMKSELQKDKHSDKIVLWPAVSISTFRRYHPYWES